LQPAVSKRAAHSQAAEGLGAFIPVLREYSLHCRGK
jgi:hypothetical protein